MFVHKKDMERAQIVQFFEWPCVSFSVGVYIAKAFASLILIAYFRFAVCAQKILQAVKFVTTRTIVVGRADTFLVDTEAWGSSQAVMTLWVLRTVTLTCVVPVASNGFIVWARYICGNTAVSVVAVIIW